MSFTVTHNSAEITATERAIQVVFNDDGSLRTLRVTATRPTLGGEDSRLAAMEASRAADVLTAAGVSPATIRNALLLLIREATLDRYDDARQP